MTDPFERPIDYLRLSITDACNYQCQYCKKSARRNQLGLNEIRQLLPAFRAAGIRKVRITGGEPLMHPDVAAIVAACSNERFEDIAMTTNGLLLEEMIPALKKSGLGRVNVSLNSLHAGTYRTITGTDGLDPVIRGIEAAERAGLTPVKLNVVLIRNSNDGEIERFLDLTEEHPWQIRFIEYMPMGSSLDTADIRITQEEVLARFPQLIRDTALDTPAAEGYRIPGNRGSIGFISPVSHPFCRACSRLRVTSGLTLRPCLGSNNELDLRPAMRSNDPEAAIAQVIAQAIRLKPERGFCSGFQTERPMSEIGG